ncbi:MAG: hypothetical protein ACHQ9S_01600 [Candidatus Binatia bacterium]
MTAVCQRRHRRTPRRPLQHQPPDRGLILNVHDVDAATLATTPVSSAVLSIPDASALFLIPSLAAGRFGTTLHDQLVLAYHGDPEVSADVNDQVVTIDFDATLQPTVKAALNLETKSWANAFVVRSGRLNWFGQFDQAVILAANGDFGAHPDIATMRVLTFGCVEYCAPRGMRRQAGANRNSSCGTATSAIWNTM